MAEVKKVWKYDPSMGESFDLTESLGQRKLEAPSIRVPLTFSTYAMVEGNPQAWMGYDDLHIEYEQVGLFKRREQLMRTEEWGNTTVEYWTWWMDHYYWWVPTKVDGKSVFDE